MSGYLLRSAADWADALGGGCQKRAGDWVGESAGRQGMGERASALPRSISSLLLLLLVLLVARGLNVSPSLLFNTPFPAPHVAFAYRADSFFVLEQGTLAYWDRFGARCVLLSSIIQSPHQLTLASACAGALSSTSKGRKGVIDLRRVVAVETVTESTFQKPFMFQLVHDDVHYIQV